MKAPKAATTARRIVRNNMSKKKEAALSAKESGAHNKDSGVSRTAGPEGPHETNKHPENKKQKRGGAH